MSSFASGPHKKSKKEKRKKEKKSPRSGECPESTVVHAQTKYIAGARDRGSSEAGSADSSSSSKDVSAGDEPKEGGWVFSVKPKPKTGDMTADEVREWQDAGATVVRAS